MFLNQEVISFHMESIYDEMRSRDIKIFGSFERCKERLQRFIDSEKKLVHIETIPVINDSDKKVIHIEVKTNDDEEMFDVAKILASMQNLEEGLQSIINIDIIVEKYRKLLIDVSLQPELYEEYKTRCEMETFIEWSTAHNDFIKNGFICTKG
jgi:hypothetical protein